MRPTTFQIRIPFLFAIALSAITVICNLAGYAKTGNQAVGLHGFLCFLPIVFLFAAGVQRQTVDYIAALEARIRQLEGKTPVS